MGRKWISSTNIEIDDDGRIAVSLPPDLIQGGRLKVDAGSGVGGGTDLTAITGDPARTLADLYSAMFDPASEKNLIQLLIDALYSGGDVNGARTPDLLVAPWGATITEMLVVPGWPGRGLGELMGTLEPVIQGMATGMVDQSSGQLWLSEVLANLRNAGTGQSLLAQIDATLQANLFNPYSGVPWLGVINSTIASYLTDQTTGQPALLTISNRLQDNLYDPSYGKSLVAWVRDGLFDPYYGQTVTAMLRGALFDGGTTPWLSEVLSTAQAARDNLYDPSYGKSLTAWVRDACYDPAYGQTLMAMLRGALYDGYQSWLYEIRAAMLNPSTGSPWAYEGNVTLGAISSTVATMQGDISAMRSDISTMRSSMGRLEACITWDNYLQVRY